MLLDMHTHCDFSQDCTTPLYTQLDAAVKRGITTIAVTDHIDCEYPAPTEYEQLNPNMKERNIALEAAKARYPMLNIRKGMEVGMQDEACAKRVLDHIGDTQLDFVIGSVHVIDGLDVYFPSFHKGHTRESAYTAYLEALNKAIRAFPLLCSMGHYDQIAKCGDYTPKAMEYDVAPELFDSIFRYLIENGKTLEINTSCWKEEKAWGLSVIKRFRELGGEFITIGSDAHTPDRVGKRFDEAYELAKAAGIRYVADFVNLQAKPVKI